MRHPQHPMNSTHEQSELARSASEASKIVVRPVRSERYLNPRADTPFPLEYAFHLLGDVKDKLVLDLGCGSGEEVIPLLRRGARVIGIDLSPELIEVAKQRLRVEGLDAEVRVGSAYETGLADSSADVIFCMSLIHHLDISKARGEMLRILRPGGVIILKEPVRFSRSYNFVRSFLPAHEDVSTDEHPLTEDELRSFQEGFQSEGLRFFRLPFVPLVLRSVPAATDAAFRFSDKLIAAFPNISRYATSAVVRLRKPGL